MIVGLTSDDRGLLPDVDVRRMKERGEEIMRRFEAPIAATAGTSNEVVLNLPNGSKVNHIILQEKVQQGERIRKFRIEGFVNGSWKKLYDGSCIGHKHIFAIEPEQARQVAPCC